MCVVCVCSRGVRVRGGAGVCVRVSVQVCVRVSVRVCVRVMCGSAEVQVCVCVCPRDVWVRGGAGVCVCVCECARACMHVSTRVCPAPQALERSVMDTVWLADALLGIAVSMVLGQAGPPCSFAVWPSLI